MTGAQLAVFSTQALILFLYGINMPMTGKWSQSISIALGFLSFVPLAWSFFLGWKCGLFLMALWFPMAWTFGQAGLAIGRRLRGY